MDLNVQTAQKIELVTQQCSGAHYYVILS